MQYLYAIHDWDIEKKKEGCIYLPSPDVATMYNERGYGIFWSVNSFNSPVRREDNLEKIVCWYIDLDKGSKADQEKLIQKYVMPSMVVESKNGYHCYWLCGENVYPADYKFFLRERLTYYFKSDTNATDITRVLRSPGYYHLKNPSDPFLVKKVHSNNNTYLFNQMRASFPMPEIAKKKIIKRENRANTGDSFVNKIYRIDCEYGLEKLSGKSCVNGEIFTFRSLRNGNKNIYVNGKSTSCFIDTDGLIGSSDGGGPSIGHWLHWYLKDWNRVEEVLKNEFTEL